MPLKIPIPDKYFLGMYKVLEASEARFLTYRTHLLLLLYIYKGLSKITGEKVVKIGSKWLKWLKNRLKLTIYPQKPPLFNH